MIPEISKNEYNAFLKKVPYQTAVVDGVKVRYQYGGKVAARMAHRSFSFFTDLILQEAETVSSDSEIKRIIGIFDCKRNEAKCVLWDVNDCTEYYFCGVTGELMYSAWSYGFVVSTEPYSHYYFDEEWNEIEDYTLVVYCIDSEMDEEYAEIWKQENPDMAEDGIYYRKYTDEGEEILTREELESIYEMETGYEFSSEFY